MKKPEDEIKYVKFEFTEFDIGSEQMGTIITPDKKSLSMMMDGACMTWH